MTTKLQRDADRLDLMIFRAAEEALRLAREHPNLARDFNRAAGDIRSARVYVREHMHPADRKGDGE